MSPCLIPRLIRELRLRARALWGFSSNEENTMKNVLGRGSLLLGLLLSALFITSALYAEKNQVMGELRFEGRSEVERTSGVWIDKEYVGYLKELKGSKKVLLLPGEHLVTVRQDGYQEFTQQVLIQPGQTEVINVAMARAPNATLPAITAEVKLSVNPSRAAVFVDGSYVGHVKEFQGMGRGMLVSPGDHQISIALPGYEAFETNVKPLPNQKVEIKTDLLKSSGPLEEPLVNEESGQTTPPPGSPNTASAQAR